MICIVDSLDMVSCSHVYQNLYNVKAHYIVCLENFQHGLAFLFTKEVPLPDEWDVVGKGVEKRRFRQGVILKRPPVSVKSVVLSHAEDAFLVWPVGLQRHRKIEE